MVIKQKFDIQGMTCSACQGHVEKAVQAVLGVEQAEVHLLTNSMQVSYEERKVTTDTIIQAVQSAGYDATVSGERGSIIVDDLNKRKRKVIVSFILLAMLMYFSMHDMIGLPIFTFMHEQPLWNVAAQVILLIPILWLHRSYFKNGFKSLWKANPTMDSLIALGAGAAVLYSIYATIQMINHPMMANHLLHSLYYESAATIVVLISFGKYLEARSKQKTTDAISKLLNLAPKTATIVTNDIESIVPVEELQIGDIVLVKANETIPVDGTIIKGESSVDEAMITGESLPVEKQLKDTVIGGTHNLQGSFLFEVKSTVENSTLAKIIELVEEASSSKAPITSMVDKVVKWFVPIVIVIAIMTFVVWMALGESLTFALSNAIAVLVISCPCALGLATPVAIMVATGVGAKQGILLKSASVLENERSIDVVVLDKTGTITKGQAAISDIYSTTFSEAEVLQYATSLEKGSSHVLANAFIERAEKDNIELLDVQDFESLSGLGLQGIIQGNTYFIGNHKLMIDRGIIVEDYEAIYQGYMNEGKTCVFIAQNNTLIGIVAIYDEIKPTSKEAIQNLKAMGIEVIMLTGDSKRAANAINTKVNVDRVIAEVLPEDKENVIKELQSQGKHVLMVGDGINDAPALVRSDVGLAIGAGNDIAIDSADVILMKDDLRDISTSIALSKRTVRTIKQNLFWAFIYNCVSIPVAAGVFYYAYNLRLDAMIAAACMSFSSVCVIFNALRLRGFKAKHQEVKKMKKEIMIEGMSCVHCQKRVEDALSAIDNTKVTIILKENKAIVESTASNQVLQSAIEQAGYTVKEIKNV